VAYLCDTELGLLPTSSIWYGMRNFEGRRLSLIDAISSVVSHRPPVTLRCLSRTGKGAARYLGIAAVCTMYTQMDPAMYPLRLVIDPLDFIPELLSS